MYGEVKNIFFVDEKKNRKGGNIYLHSLQPSLSLSDL